MEDIWVSCPFFTHASLCRGLPRTRHTQESEAHFLNGLRRREFIYTCFTLPLKGHWKLTTQLLLLRGRGREIQRCPYLRVFCGTATQSQSSETQPESSGHLRALNLTMGPAKCAPGSGASAGSGDEC